MPQWMSANRIGFVIGLAIAGVVSVPVGRFVALVTGATLGGAWGGDLAGYFGVAIGIWLGFFLVLGLVSGTFCLVGMAAGSLVELLVKRIRRAAAH